MPPTTWLPVTATRVSVSAAAALIPEAKTSGAFTLPLIPSAPSTSPPVTTRSWSVSGADGVSTSNCAVWWIVLAPLPVSPAPLIVIATFGDREPRSRSKLPAESWIVGFAPAGPLA
jgi:hypothetical protein